MQETAASPTAPADAPQGSGRTTSASPERLVLFAVLAMAAVTLFLASWVHEDAFITLRVVDNALNGHGLRWNVAERVQVYTHPLWMLLLLGGVAVIGDPWWVVILLGWFCTAGVLGLIIHLSRSKVSAAFVIFLLALTRSFADWSSSGLENSLSHLLFCVFAWLWLERRGHVGWFTCMASLAAMTRPDSVLFYGVPILVTLWRERDRLLRNLLRVLAGSLPLVGWTVFSVIYYGFPLPNTAYAKLGHGITDWELFTFGLAYLAFPWTFDPLVPLTIIGALIIVGIYGTREEQLLAAGPVMYLLYLLKIGGDYMTGRFWSLPLVACALLLGRQRFQRPVVLLPVAGVALVLGMFFTNMPVLRGLPGEEKLVQAPPNITDDRLYMYHYTGIVSKLAGRSYREHPWAREGFNRRLSGPPLVIAGGVGMFGYRAGPKVHIIDYYALTDPLLARLPSIENPFWRIGHHLRFIPDGYEDTLLSGRNQLQDEQLARYWDHLHRVIADPIWSRERWQSLWLLNTGALDHLIDQDAYKRPFRETLTEDDIAKLRGLTLADAISREALVPRTGTVIHFNTVRHRECLLLELSPTDTFTVNLQLGEETVAEFLLELHGEPMRYVALHSLLIPPEVAQGGYDRMQIVPAGIAEVPSLGGLRFCDGPAE